MTLSPCCLFGELCSHNQTAIATPQASGDERCAERQIWPGLQHFHPTDRKRMVDEDKAILLDLHRWGVVCGGRRGTMVCLFSSFCFRQNSIPTVEVTAKPRVNPRQVRHEITKCFGDRFLVYYDTMVPPFQGRPIPPLARWSLPAGLPRL